MKIKYNFSYRLHHGLSLIEILISLAIGSLLMVGLVSSFQTSSEAQKELEKSGILIENGRYAVNIIADDLKLAGFYGYYFDLGDPLTTLSDPCEIADLNAIQTALAMPIQGYLNGYTAGATTMSCDDKGLFSAANVSATSDILVIRRVDTGNVLGWDDINSVATNESPVANEIYLQSNTREVDVQLGNASRTVNLDAVSGGDNSSDTADASNPNNDDTIFRFPYLENTTRMAEIRKLRVHVYFVAPCSIGSGTNGVCTSDDDDIPTLKRLELKSVSGATTMELVPLVEGVEYFKVQYGLDTVPAGEDAVTGQPGDSMPDTYTTLPSTASDWADVVSVRVFILARATDATQGYTDSRTYNLAGVTVDPPSDVEDHRRQVFTTEVRPMNLAGRREIPE